MLIRGVFLQISQNENRYLYSEINTYSEQSQREFFRQYFSTYPHLKNNLQNILIDSAGLPNAIHFPLTALSTHNGISREEVRLTYVEQLGTSLPVYFQ